jgi:hypothetical protein
MAVSDRIELEITPMVNGYRAGPYRFVLPNNMVGLDIVSQQYELLLAVERHKVEELRHQLAIKPKWWQRKKGDKK